MKNVLVLGSEGMLGRYVSSELRNSKTRVYYTNRENFNIDENLNQAKVEELINDFSPDFVVNCIGMIKPVIDTHGPKMALIVNSLLPRMLSDSCKKRNIDFIHITTDCVFSGRHGPSNEHTTHDAEDIYGRTKSLGEPDDCVVIRTSIIGEELKNKRSLIEWVKSNEGGEINGFVNHIWNGVTCLQLAKIIAKIVNEEIPTWAGVKHIHSNSMTKYDLIKLICQKFKLDMSVKRTVATTHCDRSLETIKDFPIAVPPLDVQIEELAAYKLQ